MGGGEVPAPGPGFGVWPSRPLVAADVVDGPYGWYLQPRCTWYNVPFQPMFSVAPVQYVFDPGLTDHFNSDWYSGSLYPMRQAW